jgi:NAD(P)H-nitrite reductase large subunit
MAEHVMPANLDADAAAILQRHLEQNGIGLILGDSVKRFKGSTAELQSGGEVPFDVLVIAAGVRPETQLFAAAGGKIGRGVPVDEQMKTALPDVWAAGDCTESLEVTTGEADVLAVLPGACMGGRCAGANMAGGSAVFDKGIKMNSIGFFGLHLMSAGTYTDLVYSEVTETTCKKLFAKGNRLTGFILVGDVARAGIYTALIRNQTPLDSIDFEAIKCDPSLIPFGRDYRAQKLGGVV